MLRIILICLGGFVLTFSISTYLHYDFSSSLFAGSVTAELLLVTAFFVSVGKEFARIKNTAKPFIGKLSESAYAVAEKWIPRKILRLLMMEINVFRVVLNAIARKKCVPSDSLLISYGKEWRLIGYILIVIAAVELVVVDIACSIYFGETSFVRFVALAVSVYMLIWITGYVLASKIMPHYINDSELVIRCGISHFVKIRLSDISHIEMKRLDLEKRKSMFTSNSILRINNGNQTNELTVFLLDGSSFLVDGTDLGAELNGVSFSVDFPKNALMVLKEKIR